MRDIDTDALRNVSPVLGVGNPASATRPVVFDDANLQQVLDVSRMVPGHGLEDGWISQRLEAQVASPGGAGNEAREDISPYDIITQLGFSKTTSRAWLTSVQMWTEKQALDTPEWIFVAVNWPRIPIVAPNPDTVFLISYANAFAEAVLTTGEHYLAIRSSTDDGDIPAVSKLPLYIPPGGTVRMVASADIGSGAPLTMGADCIFWVGPRGARPPGLP